MLVIDQSQGNQAFKGKKVKKEFFIYWLLIAYIFFKQIIEFLEPIQSDNLQVVVDPPSIPKHFTKITNLVIKKVNSLTNINQT